jgi:hypothetical protein
MHHLIHISQHACGQDMKYPHLHVRIYILILIILLCLLQVQNPPITERVFKWCDQSEFKWNFVNFFKKINGTCLHIVVNFLSNCWIWQQGGVLLTSYEVFRSKHKLITCEGTKMIEWNYIFLDEGHRIKNEETQTSQAFSTLKCAHKIVITGTPFQNNLKV